MTAFLNFALLVLVLAAVFGLAGMFAVGGLRLVERPARRRSSRRTRNAEPRSDRARDD